MVICNFTTHNMLCGELAIFGEKASPSSLDGT